MIEAASPWRPFFLVLDGAVAVARARIAGNADLSRVEVGIGSTVGDTFFI